MSKSYFYQVQGEVKKDLEEGKVPFFRLNKTGPKGSGTPNDVKAAVS